MKKMLVIFQGYLLNYIYKIFSDPFHQLVHIDQESILWTDENLLQLAAKEDNTHHVFQVRCMAIFYVLKCIFLLPNYSPVI